MSRRNKKKIDVNAAESPQPGLNVTLSNLQLPNLPDAVDAPAPLSDHAPQQIWKLGRVVLRRETAHRGGKTVIVVDDFATHLPLSVIERLAKRLRAGCGCGGAVKGRTIELQGDHPGKVRVLLEAEGFQVGGIR